MLMLKEDLFVMMVEEIFSFVEIGRFVVFVV